jgi:hypothetical protein
MKASLSDNTVSTYAPNSGSNHVLSPDTQLNCGLANFSTSGCGGEYPKSKGVSACIDYFTLSGDFLTAGLVLDKVTWYFRDSGLAVTGTQVLSAAVDYGSYTIPNGVVWQVGRSGAPGDGGIVTENDLCTFEFDNLGLQSGTISGWTLDHTLGFNGSGVVETGVPLSGVLSPYQKFEFDFTPFSGITQDFPGVEDPLRTDMEFNNDASGYLIPNPFDFAIIVYGTGGTTGPGRP